MNSYGFALTLAVACFIGAASATVHEHLGGVGEFGHAGIGGHGFRHGGLEGGLGLEQFDDAILLEEVTRRGHRVGGFGSAVGGLGGNSFGGVGSGIGGVEKFGRVNRLGRRAGFGGVGGVGSGLRQRGALAGAGLGGVGAAGAAGFRDSQSSLGSLNANSNNFESGLAEQGKAGLLAGKKEFDAGQNFNTRNENEGLHKHQLINSDKTIIKDRTTGVNDVDSFRNSNGVSEGSHIGGSESGIAAGAAGSRIEGESANNRNVNALRADSSNTAAGAVGGVVA